MAELIRALGMMKLSKIEGKQIIKIESTNYKKNWNKQKWLEIKEEKNQTKNKKKTLTKKYICIILKYVIVSIDLGERIV